jgi:hypothetical protein
LSNFVLLNCKKVIMFKIYTVYILLITMTLAAQSNDSRSLRKEKLKKTLLAYYQLDSQKQDAAIFLLDNMEIQFSQNYLWVDNKGKKVPFNELAYSSKAVAVKEFQKLKDSIKIKPKPYKVFDLDVISEELLIKNIDLAFEAWRNNPWSKSYDFNTFCEYILPYRSIVEPLEDWRSDYQILVLGAAGSVKNKSSAVDVASNEILALKDFTSVNERIDPIPFLSPKQLLFRREGACNDLANLSLLACRSSGLAVTFDFTPFYGASSNRHFWNTIINEKGEHIPFNGNCYANLKGLPYAYNATEKRLAKVFRKTYSIQKTALAAVQDSTQIPKGFLMDKNILDVTSEYVPTGSINYVISKDQPATIAYINVFNQGRWNTTDWGKKNGNNVQFKNLGTKIVYLPSIYDDKLHKMAYAAYPVLLNAEKNEVLLKPDYSKTFSFDVTRDKTKKGPTLDFNSFEVFNDEIFTLMIWDNGWKKLEQVEAQNNVIHFSKIPDNGLFLAVCSKSNAYERIFRINNETKQIEWY